MKTKKTYQDWCVDMLLAILKSRAEYCGDDHDQGYIYVIKAIINHYASMYYCNGLKKLMRNDDKEHINLWWDHLNDGNRKEFFSPLLMSKLAWRKVHSRTPTKDLKRHLHLEHITPVGWIYRRLCALGKAMRGNLSKDDILPELKYDRLVLLTKKQSKKHLDGAKQYFTQKDVDWLRFHFPTFSKVHNHALSSLVGCHAKDSGFGLLRMARLANFGVSFITADGRDCPPDQWNDYFDETEFVITEEAK